MDEAPTIGLFETLVPVITLLVIIVLGVIALVQQFQRSLFRQRLTQENLRMKHQQELLRTAIDVQEKERQRIAGDLHDELGARLSMALMQLKQSNGQGKLEMNQLEAMLPQIEEHLEIALSSTKRISYELMPPQLASLGLYKALLVLVGEARQSGAIQVAVDMHGDHSLLNRPLQLGLFRMISELLNNTLKHAEASEVRIELNVTDGMVHCQYRDNGKGLPEVREQAGLGLQSLEGRCSALNGILELGNAPEGGFFANIQLPVVDEESPAEPDTTHFDHPNN